MPRFLFHLASISRKHQLSIHYAPGLRLGAGHSRRTALGPVLQGSRSSRRPDAQTRGDGCQGGLSQGQGVPHQATLPSLSSGGFCSLPWPPAPPLTRAEGLCWRRVSGNGCVGGMSSNHVSTPLLGPWGLVGPCSPRGHPPCRDPRSLQPSALQTSG